MARTSTQTTQGQRADGPLAWYLRRFEQALGATQTQDIRIGRGVTDSGFYKAPEFDLVGYFLSIDDAADSIIDEWMDSLVSVDMKYRREPFKNQLLEDEIAQENNRNSLEQAEKILDTKTYSERELLWEVLFRGGKIQEVEICADLLTLWIKDANEEPLIRGIGWIVSRTLDKPDLVFKHLENTHRWHIAMELGERAKREREAAEGELRSRTGVSRMSPAYELDAAKKLEDRLLSAISHVESMR